MIAELELQQGNLEAGRAALDKVPADKITDPQPYMNIGILLINKKKPAEAESAFDRVIAIKPDGVGGLLLPGPLPAAAQEERGREGRPEEGQGARARRRRTPRRSTTC